MKIKPSEAVVGHSIDGSAGRKEVDYTKEWSNGHKVLSSAEAGALTQLMKQEERIRNQFEKHKYEMIRPRNPLIGEPTPRDERGEVVMNPNLNRTVRNGSQLLRPNTSPSMIPFTSTRIKPRKTELQGKIGVSEDIYKVLGNSEAELTPSQPQDLFMVTRHVNQEKLRRREEQTKIDEYIAREKAKRYEKELAREIYYLQQQAEEKAKRLAQLQTRYHL